MLAVVIVSLVGLGLLCVPAKELCKNLCDNGLKSKCVAVNMQHGVLWHICSVYFVGIFDSVLPTVI